MKINKYFLIFLSVIFLMSCEKDTEGLSSVTYYCDLELKGNSVELVALNGTYTEPGWDATEKGVDVSANVTVAGTVNASVAGLYTLTYSVKNVDGFAKSLTRRIIVADATPSALESGVYTVSSSSNRNGVAYGRDFPILIFQASPAEFFISDFLGGWYEQRAGYGSNYAMTGRFTLAGDNTLSLVSSSIIGWGDGLDGISNGVYNPATKTISWTATYVGTLNFNVTATKE